jgi:general transcription factor 3C polypeptide 3 (transcription factor C subunit 4)
LIPVKRDREIFRRSDSEIPQDTDFSSGALIPNRKRAQPPPLKPADPNSPLKPRKRNNEKAAIEARLREHVLNAWDKLETLKPGMTRGKKEDVDTWMTIARDLLDEFRSVKSFFPMEKNRRITWFDEDPAVKEGVGRKRKLEDIETRLEEMQNRLQGSSGSPQPNLTNYSAARGNSRARKT